MRIVQAMCKADVNWFPCQVHAWAARTWSYPVWILWRLLTEMQSSHTRRSSRIWCERCRRSPVGQHTTGVLIPPTQHASSSSQRQSIFYQALRFSYFFRLFSSGNKNGMKDSVRQDDMKGGDKGSIINAANRFQLALRRFASAGWKRVGAASVWVGWRRRLPADEIMQFAVLEATMGSGQECGISSSVALFGVERYWGRSILCRLWGSRLGSRSSVVSSPLPRASAVMRVRTGGTHVWILPQPPKPYPQPLGGGRSRRKEEEGKRWTNSLNLTLRCTCVWISVLGACVLVRIVSARARDGFPRRGRRAVGGAGGRCLAR